MRLKDLPAGARVFVDANLFTYYWTGTDVLAQACAAFFQRTARGEVEAVTSVVVAMEITHRVILQEASEQSDLRGLQLVQYLKTHPDVVKGLTRHSTIASVIYRLGVSIEPITYVHVHASRLVRQEYGLMANDSLIVAFMEKQRIRHLATNDEDFKRVPGIQVWRPH